MKHDNEEWVPVEPADEICHIKGGKFAIRGPRLGSGIYATYLGIWVKREGEKLLKRTSPRSIMARGDFGEEVKHSEVT